MHKALFKVEGVDYRIADGVEDLVENKKVSVSFFSGGKKSRNVELLKKIILPKSGKTLFDVAYKHYALNNREWLAERMKIFSAKDAIDSALLDVLLLLVLN